MAFNVRKLLIPMAICIALSACESTRNREAESQAQFNAAVKAQKTQIADTCNRLQSEAQRRFCISEPPQ